MFVRLQLRSPAAPWRAALAGLVVLALALPAIAPLDHEHGALERTLVEAACVVDHGRAVSLPESPAAPRVDQAAANHHHRCTACRRDCQRNAAICAPGKTALRPILGAAGSATDSKLRSTLPWATPAPRGPPAARV